MVVKREKDVKLAMIRSALVLETPTQQHYRV